MEKHCLMKNKNLLKNGRKQQSITLCVLWCSLLKRAWLLGQIVSVARNHGHVGSNFICDDKKQMVHFIRWNAFFYFN